MFNDNDGSYTKVTKVSINKPSQAILMGLIFLIIGVGGLIYSIYQFADYIPKSKSYIETEAVVVDTILKGDQTYYEVYEYEANGSKHSITSTTSSSTPKSIGSTKSIKYNPNNPNDIIYSFDIWMIVIGVGSVLFILMSSFIIVKNYKKGKEEGFDSGENSVIKGYSYYDPAGVKTTRYDNASSAYEDPLKKQQEYEQSIMNNNINNSQSNIQNDMQGNINDDQAYNQDNSQSDIQNDMNDNQDKFNNNF